MEVKVNKEIREYTESLYFGLSIRQFFFSLLACIAAVCLYFLFIPHLNLEVTSWICVIGAFPFAGLGWFKYHGMNAEKFIMVWIKSEITMPKKLFFKAKNIYYELMRTKRAIPKKQKRKKDNR